MSEPTAGDAVFEDRSGAGQSDPTQPPTLLTQPPPPTEPAVGTNTATETTDDEAIARIATRARRLAGERVRAALDEPATADPGVDRSSELDDEQLDRIADEEAERADGALLHVAVVHAVSQELGIDLQAAVHHPAVDRALTVLGPSAREIGADATSDGAPDTQQPQAEAAGAPTDADDQPPVLPTRRRALLLDAVHVFGIETLEPGDRDIELRLADVGIDVRKPSTAEIIGRLRWDEVRSVAVQRPRRGLPGRRRPALLVAGTDRGEVTFELSGVSDDDIVEHVEPLIARNTAGRSDSTAD